MSTNISKQKRDSLITKVKAIRTYIATVPQDENTSALLSYIGELEKEIKTKKYGLVFEEHREAIDEILESHTPVLVEGKELFVDKDGNMNFLIEGDNLASLSLLLKTHKNCVDLIYIDPPYNRGKKDFIYDDKYIDENDTFRHSKWGSFMQKRLYLAKQLMKKDALIFISIDDNEDSSLKLICDEIFGAENFINKFIWQRNSSGKTEKDKFTVNTEYILLYSKTRQFALNPAYKPLAKSSISMYSKDDNDGRGKYATVSLQKPKDPGPETTFDYVDNTGRVWKCPAKGWRMIYSKIKELENDNRLYFAGKSLRVKDYWNERENEGKRIDTLWNDISENNVGSKELELALGEKGVFDNPKPTDLIQRCLQIGNKNAIVLDFFAGSGTTAQAVLKQNGDDKGNRIFILCTNNENNICKDVTYQRCKKVIEKENYQASLKYYKVEYVPISERMYYEYADELLLHIRELVELENGINFTENSKIAIALTDDELAEFIADIDNFQKCHILYLGHDLLPTEEQESVLMQNNIKINIIPDYYYRDLQEG